MFWTRPNEKPTATGARSGGLLAGGLAFIGSEDAVGDVHSVATLKLESAIGGRCKHGLGMCMVVLLSTTAGTSFTQ